MWMACFLQVLSKGDRFAAAAMEAQFNQFDSREKAIISKRALSDSFRNKMTRATIRFTGNAIGQVTGCSRRPRYLTGFTRHGIRVFIDSLRRFFSTSSAIRQI
jgi:hypothetical protein